MDVHRQVASFAAQLTGLAIWLVLLLIVFVPLERIFAHRSQKVLRRSFGQDIVYYFLNGIFPKLMMVLPLTIVSAAAHRLAPSAYYASIAAMPVWMRLAAALLLNEIGGYWGHRWSHEIPLLWRFHAIHHSAEEIDWLVTARAHPVDIFFTHFCALVPLYAAGFAQPLGTRVDFVPAAVTAISMYWAYFVHANLNWRFGWLEMLVSTPGFHHWHHTNDGPEVIDKNFSAMFPWVDKIFGTLHLPPEWPGKYGTDTPVRSELSRQLLDPCLPQETDGAEPASVATS